MTTESHPHFRGRVGGAAFLLLALLLAGCQKTEVTSVRVPKEKDVELPVTVAAGATATAPAGMAATPVAAAAGSGLTWSAPAGWPAKPLSTMRKGSYTVPGAAGAEADLSITAFPGAVGGELANVNRWRGQVGLPPVAEGELEAAVARVAQNGLAFTVVDLAGADTARGQRMLGAMAPFEGSVWFFKLTGPDALVAATKPAFLEFLKTVKAAAPAHP